MNPEPLNIWATVLTTKSQIVSKDSSTYYYYFKYVNLSEMAYF